MAEESMDKVTTLTALAIFLSFVSAFGFSSGLTVLVCFSAR